MSGTTFSITQNSKGFVVTIYKHNAEIRKRVAEIIGQPVKRVDFPTGQPVFVPTTEADEGKV